MAKKNKKSRVGLSNEQVLKKQYSNNLDVCLEKIYNKYNLKTTCDNNGECCLVACPQLNYCEFLNIIDYIWNNFTKEEKTNILTKSIEYFFKNQFEKWGIQTLVKPCMLYDKKKKGCKIYDKRHLSCRMYGLWPSELYEERVSRFEKAYSKFGLTRRDLPLNTQCDCVKSCDGSKLTKEIIEELYRDLDQLDSHVSSFSKLQIENKNNYRAFHDWIMYVIFGEEWLSTLTTFVLAAKKEEMEDLVVQLKNMVISKMESGEMDVKFDGKENV